MRRQRHASPSPAQATAHSTEEDGHAKGAKQAGTNSSTRSNVWRSARSPPLITCESHTWTRPLFPPTTVTLSELRLQHRIAPLRTLVFLSSTTSYSQVTAFHRCTAVLLHPELMLVKKVQSLSCRPDSEAPFGLEESIVRDEAAGKRAIEM